MSWFLSGAPFFAIIRRAEPFPSPHPSSWWSYSGQPPFRIRCAFLEVLGTWTLSAKNLSYILVHQELPLYSVESPGPARLCRLRRFFQMQAADQQVVIGRQFCTPFDMNVQHWTEQIRWNHAEINEWPLTRIISIPSALVGFHFVWTLHVPG